MKRLNTIGWVLSFAFVVTSCERETEQVPVASGVYEKGVLVANEGNFMKPNAELSYINYSIDKIQNDVYKSANDENLGDVLQSVEFQGDNAYLVINNSNKIVVADRYTFKKKQVVSQELKHPRYIAFAENKYYVTNAQNGGFVAVYNTADNSFVKKISIGNTSERIVKAGENLFVQNSSYGSGETLTVISSKTDAVTGTIHVPNGNIQRTIGYKNNVYVLSSAGNDTHIYQYSPQGTLTKTYDLYGFSAAKQMAIENDVFYFTSGTKCYALPFNATQSPDKDKPLFSVVDNGWSTFYGFDVIDGFIYTSEANRFTQNAEVAVYSITGKLVKNFTAGIGANGFYKN